jgi:hypothetical protein
VQKTGDDFVYQVKPNSLMLNLVTAALQVALIVVLAAAGWSIYRYLPHSAGGAGNGDAKALADTALRISLRGPSREAGAAKNVQVELYPIDILAARNEFFSERRPGKRLDDFLAERMGNRSPVEGRFDNEGQVTLMVKPGPWWIHTTLPGELNIEWRLRVNVSGSRQTVELTPDNAYTRTKSF